MAPKHSRLSRLETLFNGPARAVIQPVLAATLARQCTQMVGYERLVAGLREMGIPEKEIPSPSAFNRAVLSDQAERMAHGGDRRGAYPVSLSDGTRRHLAAGLRSLADDLEHDTNDQADDGRESDR